VRGPTEKLYHLVPLAIAVLTDHMTRARAPSHVTLVQRHTITISGFVIVQVAKLEFGDSSRNARLTIQPHTVLTRAMVQATKEPDGAIACTE